MRGLGVPAQLGRLKRGEATVELRFVNTDGETEAWIIDKRALDLRFIRDSCVSRAYIDDGVDSRLANQGETIGRLTKHVAYHHDQLGMVPAEACPVLKGEVKL